MQNCVYKLLGQTAEQKRSVQGIDYCCMVVRVSNKFKIHQKLNI